MVNLAITDEPSRNLRLCSHIVQTVLAISLPNLAMVNEKFWTIGVLRGGATKRLSHIIPPSSHHSFQGSKTLFQEDFYLETDCMYR